MPSSNDSYLWFRLLHTKGASPKTIHRVFSHTQSSGKSIPDIVPNLADSPEILKEFQRLQQENITLIHLGSPNYPAKLTRTMGDDAPPILFCYGCLKLLNTKGIAIVGSCKPTPTAAEFAGALACECARRKLNVVSGFAKGVDSAAHIAALKARGTTTFVLPFGMFHFTLEHEMKQLAGEASWLALSQFPPTIPWSSSNAIRRNKITAALSHAVIVIESGPEKNPSSGRGSGTFNTAKSALAMRLPLFVVDPALLPNHPRGNRDLIRLGAHPINPSNPSRCLDEILHVLTSSPPTSHSPSQPSLF